MLSSVKKYPLGEACLCWSFGEDIDRQLSRLVLRVYRRIKSAKDVHLRGIRDVVPAYSSLAVYFDPLFVETTVLVEVIDGLISEAARTAPDHPDDPGSARTHILPVTYDGDDLARVAQHNNLSVADVVERHTARDYTVAMIGFLPHFPYLMGLDRRLHTPRLDSPRRAVAAGSVAIGGQQAGVYPRSSPGGWNVIGSTDAGLLLAIQPGDTIRFAQEMKT